VFTFAAKLLFFYFVRKMATNTNKAIMCNAQKRSITKSERDRERNTEREREGKKKQKTITKQNGRR